MPFGQSLFILLYTMLDKHQKETIIPFLEKEEWEVTQEDIKQAKEKIDKIDKWQRKKLVKELQRWKIDVWEYRRRGGKA